jgi:hypothetical protein
MAVDVAVDVSQISSYNGNGAWQTDFFFTAQIMFLAIKSPEILFFFIFLDTNEPNTSLIFH